MHAPPKQPFRPVGLRAAATGLAAATMISACGTSSPTSSTAPTGGGSNPTTSTLAFSKCMRANGVSNFRDLSSNGMLIQGHGQTMSVNGVSVNASAYQAARAKCQKYMPTRTPASAPQRAEQIARGLKFARCMRSRGVPNFPDPKILTGPSGNQEAYLPGFTSQSPAFQAAAKACGGGPKGP